MVTWGEDTEFVNFEEANKKRWSYLKDWEKRAYTWEQARKPLLEQIAMLEMELAKVKALHGKPSNG